VEQDRRGGLDHSRHFAQRAERRAQHRVRAAVTVVRAFEPSAIEIAVGIQALRYPGRCGRKAAAGDRGRSPCRRGAWRRAPDRIVAISTPVSAPNRNDKIAPFVGDEAVAVEVRWPSSLPMRLAAITGMQFETAWPTIARRHIRLVSSVGVLRLGADRSGVEQHSAPISAMRARAFGIPLVPADADADARAEHVPHLEAVLPGRK
jgi:hypothetical protein